MKTKTFTKAELLEIMEDGDPIVLDKVMGTSRWSTQHRFVFKQENVFYETHYSKGSTELQDEGPWEHEEKIECKIVEPYERTITDYKPVP